MKRMSLQWRLTCITTLCIAIICGCLTMFVYKNGVHYIDSLQDAVESQGDEKGNKSDEIYISIPDDKWDEFADQMTKACDMLIEDCAKIVAQERVDKAFIEKHIEKISVDKDGYVIVRFINGTELTNKEEVKVCKKDQE